MAKYLFMIKPSSYVACSVLSLVKFLDHYREMFHASKIRIHLHPPYKSRLSHWEVTHNMLSPSIQNLANSDTLRTYIHWIKMPISHPENCAFIHIPCICYHKALFRFHQNHRNGLYIYKKTKLLWEKAKGAKRGKIHTRPKKLCYSPYPLKFFISFQKRVLMQGMLQ